MTMKGKGEMKVFLFDGPKFTARETKEEGCETCCEELGRRCRLQRSPRWEGPVAWWKPGRTWRSGRRWTK